jgi:hypothetical protein
VFEHKSLSKILELLGSYDQFALVNSAGAEAALKRRMVIEKAYARDPNAPSYEGSEHMLGYQDHETGRIIDPEAEKYQTARLRDEHAAARETRMKKAEDDARRKAAQEAAKHR